MFGTFRRFLLACLLAFSLSLLRFKYHVQQNTELWSVSLFHWKSTCSFVHFMSLVNHIKFLVGKTNKTKQTIACQSFNSTWALQTMIDIYGLTWFRHCTQTQQTYEVIDCKIEKFISSSLLFTVFFFRNKIQFNYVSTPYAVVSFITEEKIKNIGRFNIEQPIELCDNFYCHLQKKFNTIDFLLLFFLSFWVILKWNYAQTQFGKVFCFRRPTVWHSSLFLVCQCIHLKPTEWRTNESEFSWHNFKSFN